MGSRITLNDNTDISIMEMIDGSCNTHSYFTNCECLNVNNKKR